MTIKLLHNRLSRNTLILLFSNGGSAILSFVLSVIIGRMLGENGLGVYAAALAWIFPLSLMTEFGLGTLITRDIAHSPEKTEDYVRLAVMIRLFIGGGLMLLVWIIAPLLSDDFAVIQGLRLSVPMILLVPLYGTFTAVFRARQVMKPIAVLNLSMLMAQVILTASVFLSGGGVQAALIVNVVTSMGQVIAAWAIYRRNFVRQHTKRGRDTPSPYTLVNLLKRALPFAVAAILGALQLRLNFIFLEQFAGTIVVGQYVAASRFVEAALMIPAALFGALFPALSEMKHDPLRLKRLMRWIQLGLAIYGVLFGLGVWFFGTSVMRLTYGATFESSILILQVLAWSLLPSLLKSSRILYYYATGYENRVNIITAIVLMLQFALSLWLIRDYGAFGAAFTMIVTESASLFLLLGMSVMHRKGKL
ncbi:MAG: flippase [Anaerolineae bacterium]|nr:flippase [Anaerolineae bacterium]